MKRLLAIAAFAAMFSVDAGALDVIPDRLDFNVEAGGSAHATVRVQEDPPELMVGFSVSIVGSILINGSEWLSVEPLSATTPADIEVRVDTALLPIGSRTASIRFDPESGLAFTLVVDLTVTEPGATDTTPPVISSVAASAITSAEATISWTTDEAADSQVEYGTTLAYGSSTPLDAALVTGHSQGLTGLLAETEFHYRVKSRDEAGNLAVSGDFTFTTAPPEPSTVGVEPASVIVETASTAVATFVINVLAQPLAAAQLASSSNTENGLESGAFISTINWTAVVRLLSAPGANWLTISPTSGSATPDQPSRVTGTVGATQLPGPGTYQAEIEVTGDQTVNVPVTVVVRPDGARLSLSQTAFLFQSVSSGPLTPSQTLTISNEGDGTLSWSLSGLPFWLAASSESGTATAGAPGASVSLTADPSSFGSGVNSALLTVSAPGASNNPQVVAVVLLTVPGATPATAEISPNALVFVAEQGQPVPPNQTVAVSNVGGGTLSYTFTASTTSGDNWLTLTGQSGAAPGEVTVAANPSGLLPAIYRGTLTGSFTGGVELEVEVLLLVVEPAAALRALARGLPGAAQCAPTGLELLATTIGNGLSLPVSFPRVLTALVVDDCGSAVTNATLVAAVEGLAIPLRGLGRSGFYSGTWVPVSAAASVAVTFAALHPTLPKAQRSFTVETATAPGGASLPLLFADGVVEGAGFAKRRPLSGGGIISLFGASFATENNFAGFPLPRELAGVSVRVGSQDAPLFFVGPEQINAQVPFEVNTGDSVPVAITVDGLLTAPQNYLIAAAQPGIFISGGNAAILDASFQQVTVQNPARSGDTIQIFCTGLGAVDVTVETGAPGPSFSTVEVPVTVTIGGIDAAGAGAGLCGALPGERGGARRRCAGRRGPAGPHPGRDCRQPGSARDHPRGALRPSAPGAGEMVGRVRAFSTRG